ncbi:MAG: pyridoxal phosphate-dependent aminotransferase [Thermoprotei archaeon]|jgi:aspartate aminotransferase
MSFEKITIRTISEECDKLRKLGLRVIDAHIGAPSHVPPISVKETLDDLDRGGREYLPFVGIEELRREIAHFIEMWRGKVAEYSRVIVTSSAVHALYVVFKMFSGFKMLLPKPYFPHYFEQAEITGIKYVFYNPTAYDIVSEIISKIDSNTKAVLINYPHNPTGYYPPSEQLKELESELKSRNIVLINDAVYHEIYFDERPYFPGDILIDSFSKTFSLPGLRIGYIYWDTGDIERAGRLVYLTTAGASDFSQRIALNVLKSVTKTYLDYVRSYYKVKRDILIKMLNELDFEYPIPKGAFYAFPRHSKIKNSFELSKTLLSPNRSICIGIIPGELFGGTYNQFRISFGKLTENDIKLMRQEFEKEFFKEKSTSQ